MGYYTSYDLHLIGDAQKCQKFEHELLDMGKHEDGTDDFELSELINFGGVYAKLYDIEDWISEVAKNNPDILVILSGSGEDQDDIWESRWRGTVYDCHKAVIPPFTDPQLLTDYELKFKEALKQ